MLLRSILVSVLLLGQANAAGVGNLFSGAAISTPVVQITCNIMTGVAVGASGPCASPVATCDGVANDSSAFVSFNTWAVANQGTSQIVLTGTNGATCYFKTGGFATNAPAKNIKNLLVDWTATWQANNSDANSAFDLSVGAGICHKGIAEATGCSARIATVAAGSTSVTLTSASLSSGYISRFVVGAPMLVASYDMMGTWGIAFGYPPNPYYYDYVTITAVNAGTGQIDFTPALAYGHKSTYPLYSAGATGEADQGGPATVYALDTGWNATVEYRGLTINQTQYQTLAIAKTAIFTNVTVLGSNCIIPSQNKTWTLNGGTLTSCGLELDKIVGTATFSNVTASLLHSQSASIDNLIISNSTIGTLTGTPKNATITGSTFNNVAFGPSAFGRGNEVTCTNCVITGTLGLGGFTESGDQYSTSGFNNFYTMAGGIIKFPNGTFVSACADNGSGKARLTVTSTTGFVAGAGVATSNVLNITGQKTITAIIDGTHLDMSGVAASACNVQAGALIAHSAPRWAMPGTNLFWVGQFFAEDVFQTVDVTQDAASVCVSGPCYTYISTSLAGGFPTLPLSGGILNARVHPSPKFTCTNCSGSETALSFATCSAQAPLWSCAKYTYAGTSGAVNFSDTTVFGNLTSLTYNVTSTASSGTPLFGYNIGTVNSAGAAAFYLGQINVKTSGTRTVTLAGVTGTQAGDAGLAVPDAAHTFFGGFYAPSFSAAAAGASIDVTTITNQGIVYP